MTKNELKERLKYVEELIQEPRPSCSPSSEEWVSSEFWNYHKESLRRERDDLIAKIKELPDDETGA